MARAATTKKKTTSRTARAASARKPAARAATRAKAPRKRAKKPVVIDFHTHIVVPEVFEITRQYGLHSRLGMTGGASSMGGEERSKMTMRKMIGTTERLIDMDKMGVDIQIISPSLVHQSTYWADPEAALELDQQTNNGLAEMVSVNPDRFVGIGIVPLHDPRRAAREMERCVKRLGFKGVAISTEVNGAEIGDPKFDPFWRKAQSLGATIFIHPSGSDNPRLRRYGLSFTLGQPYEEAMAMVSLIYDGVMDRFPDLKLAIVHGGGYLPFYAGRQDYACRFGFIGKKLKDGEFSDYLPRFYFDTVLFNTDMLENLVAKVGHKHIVMGSDWPFAEERPVQYVKSAKKLTDKQKEDILGRNAAKLLGISI